MGRWGTASLKVRECDWVVDGCKNGGNRLMRVRPEMRVIQGF